jgi:hypothetical protein
MKGKNREKRKGKPRTKKPDSEIGLALLEK